MIRIRDIEIYHPANKVNNDKYLVNSDERRRHFLEDVLGKKERYEDDAVTALDLMEESSKKLLTRCNLTGEDIDLLVVGTLTPEYFSPPTAVILHNRLGIKPHSLAYDVNACCLSMSIITYQVYAMMKVNKNLKNVMIVCCDLNRNYLKEDSMMYGIAGDLSCSMIIEQNDDEGIDFIIDEDNYSYSEESKEVRFPVQPLSKLIKEQNLKDFYTLFTGKDNPHMELPGKVILEMLQRNKLGVDDISMFCVSQFALCNLEKVQNELSIADDRIMYVGDKYGYTSGNSPFLVLYEAIRQGRVKRGDYIVIWTLGAATQHIFLLLKY